MLYASALVSASPGTNYQPALPPARPMTCGWRRPALGTSDGISGSRTQIGTDQLGSILHAHPRCTWDLDLGLGLDFEAGLAGVTEWKEGASVTPRT